MNTNEKFYTDQEFEALNVCYMFSLYSSRRNADTDTNAANVMAWHNNQLTRDRAQDILVGMAAAATVKYKHPAAVLWADTPDGQRIKLSGCTA